MKITKLNLRYFDKFWVFFDLMSRVFANDQGARDSIPGRVIPES